MLRCAAILLTALARSSLTFCGEMDEAARNGDLAIGCRLAGGKWEKVEPQMSETLPVTQVYVCDLPG